MHAALTPQLLSLLPGLVVCCWHEHAGIHHSAASCSEALASAKPDDVLPALLRCDLSEACQHTPHRSSVRVVCLNF